MTFAPKLITTATDVCLQAAAELTDAEAEGFGEISEVYTVTLFVRGEEKIESNSQLSISVVSVQNSEVMTSFADISEIKKTVYQPENPSKSGTNFSGNVSLPSKFEPGVVILKLTQNGSIKSQAPLYLRKVTLESKSGQNLEYLANSYLDTSLTERYIFSSVACTAEQSSKGVKHFRNLDLKLHQGKANSGTRKGADMEYNFDVYNDLGKPLDNKVRPTLGNSKDFPFPRRIRTGRPVGSDGFEERIPDTAGKLPWVPIDERFTLIKEKTFSGLSAYSAGAVVSSPWGFLNAALSLPFIQKKLQTSEYKSLAEIDSMYDDLKATENIQAVKPALRTATRTDILESLKLQLNMIEESIEHKAESLLEKVLSFFNKKKAKGSAPVDPAENEGNLVPEEGQMVQIVNFLDGMIHRWPVPNVRKGRKDLWYTDEDFGRQVMEGQNPLVVKLVTEKDLAEFATKDSDVQGLLEGKSLDQAVGEKSIFMLDFYTHFKEFLQRVNDLPGLNNRTRVYYAGRCLLFSRKDEALVPIAIELETVGVPLTVYTPHHSPELWRLAKSVIASLETWHHQAVVHLLQTHLCVEPYIIATKRSLSVMHPINKLLQPCFRWTMRPNADARQNLISADGIIETAFTIGKYSMQLISKIYGADWRFDQQSLPDDLVARGVAEKDKEGNIQITLPGYHYAEDALLIYSALEKWVTEYVALYYDDNDPTKKVGADSELLEWWHSVREGHKDKEVGWPQLTDSASLIRILLTIMWTCGPHHAAVNYGQYQYSGYMPNRPSMTRRKIPLPGSKEEMELQKDFEGQLLATLSDPLSTATLMLMTKLLSHHSADEEFINSPDHSWIRDPPALSAYAGFVANLNAAEATIAERNQSEKRLKGGRGLPYTQMMPSADRSGLKPGEDQGHQVSFRGIPNSIAI